MSDKVGFELLALIEALDKIETYSKDFNESEEFYHDQKSFDATMMQFVVIGEVISRLDDDYKKENDQIEWQKIKNFRNIIAHDYFGIDADEIWDILNNKLLPLKKELKKLIKD